MAVVASRRDAGEIDFTLRTLAKKQAETDWEIGEWLIEADDARVYVVYGCANYCEYASRIFGWDWRQAMQRLATARALRELPALSDRLREGRIAWSAARELGRVATAETEIEWLEKTEGKSIREVEAMVAGLPRGARPSDRKNPRAITRRVVLEFNEEEYARYVRGVDAQRRGCDAFLREEDAVLGALEDRAEDSGGSDGSRSRYQLSFVRTLDTGETFIAGKDGFQPVSPETTEMLECDSVVVALPGDGAKGGRAAQTIPPSVRRQVMAAAGGRCQVPGCNRRHGLDLHHLRLRRDGGTHDASNLIVLCASHHRAFHNGWLLIEGDRTAGFRFRHVSGKTYGQPDDPASLRASNAALQTLRRLALTEDEARSALSRAREVLAERGTPVTAESLVQEALNAGRQVRRYKLRGSTGRDVSPTAHVGNETGLVDAQSIPAAHVGTRPGKGAMATAHVGSDPEPEFIEEAMSALLNLRFRKEECRRWIAEGGAALASRGTEITTALLVTEALKAAGRAKLSIIGENGIDAASLWSFVATEAEAEYGLRQPLPACAIG